MTRFALLLPLWLVFAIGEPSLVHQCPMHDAVALSHDADGAHAGHASHGSQRSQRSHSSQSAPHSHECCSCLGSCAPVAGVVVPTIALVPAATVSLQAPTAPATQVQCARREAHRVLPYANGPPA